MAGRASREEVGLNQGDIRFDEIAKFHQRWNDRFSFDDLAIAERYIDLRLNVVIDWASFGHEGLGEKYRAIFKGAKPTCGIQPQGGKLHLFALFGFGRVEGKADGAISGPHRQQQAMPIPNGEAMQPPEIVSPPGMASTT